MESDKDPQNIVGSGTAKSCHADSVRNEPCLAAASSESPTVGNQRTHPRSINSS